MDMGLAGKSVLVCASSRGLGFAIARRFAAEGARVAMVSRDEQRIAQAAADIRRETGNKDVWPFAADLTDPRQTQGMLDAVLAKTGGVDVLVNNVGGPVPGRFDDIADAAWYQGFDQVIMSAVRCIRGVLPHMRRQRWGRIVNVASSSIRQPVDDLILSNTLRAALHGLAKSLAIELGPDNILVNTLGPGRIRTQRVEALDARRAQLSGRDVREVEAEMARQIPLGRYGTPDEFAALAVFLGSAANGYITGQAILVDGGMVRAL
ncbi:oxidoreductase [Alicyclobacillus cellulosilyticus]|uniref:Oxidoreductase n=1 Tax=Alicyclobacillus cellulosilyticus TaxID=1003997 RepID=A0A917NNF9_9BACL|nr:SDR family oxidoreductase [Alicyclobacillus cellulosilyticus]GGJ13408.1 oxidoreductase [Alicyclobacillus cellulosilyticus]